MAERSFKAEVKKLEIGAGEVFAGEGILAVTKALLQSGVAYVGGYQGSPISHLMDVFADANDLLASLDVHFEASASEATAAAMLAASVVGAFQGEIARFALLAVLMPIVSGMGGNAGTQTLAVVVRALATNQLTSSNTQRMIAREFTIAAANGTMLGVLIGFGTWLFFGNVDLAIVIAMSMVINNLIAGLSGVLIPVTLDRLDIDPAVSSAVFVTMMTDVMGFFSFLGLATLFGLGA